MYSAHTVSTQQFCRLTKLFSLLFLSSRLSFKASMSFLLWYSLNNCASSLLLFYKQGSILTWNHAYKKEMCHAYWYILSIKMTVLRRQIRHNTWCKCHLNDHQVKTRPAAHNIHRTSRYWSRQLWLKKCWEWR